MGIFADMIEKMEAWKTNALLVIHYKNEKLTADESKLKGVVPQ
jgi:hypothetical protein